MPSTLATSTQYKVWRGFEPAVARPPAVPSTKITDQVGLGLVRCAKSRLDQALGRGQGSDYARMNFDNSDLRGLCFVAADEVTQYLAAQGENAKTIMVKPAGGSDHYFTIVNNGNSGNSAIVDATWKQFMEGAADKPFCLAGTLGASRVVFGQNSEIVDIYTAGMTALGQWGSYKCFMDD